MDIYTHKEEKWNAMSDALISYHYNVALTGCGQQGELSQCMNIQ